jgi:DNA repair protein RecN (Recombination protein N)
MLSELHIEHLGIISDLTLRFGPGLTALTGETGAGKTMLIEAISLLLGERAETGLIQPGADEARVEGRFIDGEDEVILARTVPVDGRSRAYVNGRLATAAVLAEFGDRLVDLHGQNSHQSLLSTSSQRAALDRFAGVDLTDLLASRKRRSGLVAELATLGGDDRTRARELDLLRFQLEELEGADIRDADEEERLEVEEEILAGAVAFREAAERAVGYLADDDGVLDQLRAALATVLGKSPFLPATERLRSAAAELDDLASDLRNTAESFEEDPERLTSVRARRQRLRELCRKYGDNLAEVLAESARLRSQLQQLLAHDDRVAELQSDIAAESEVEAKEAAKVATLRAKKAPALGKAVQEHLRHLALPKAQLQVNVSGVGPADDITFLFQANAGEVLAPLAKVASGGELARTMLALRLVLSDAPDTLIFDEVDAGIGGEAALAVGRALAELGRTHQVFVVTHLAQVAAFAQTQVVVQKSTVGGRTVATATAVSEDDRTRELSRMLSGLAESASAKVHAQELLATAQAAGHPADR